MNLEISRKRVSKLMSRFVTEIKSEASMGRTDLNKAAETILIPLLSEIYGWNLVNVNYAEDDNNYPGIDLADKAAKVSIQVTATTNSEKVKHTLRQFVKYEQYLEYDRLIIFFLKERQNYKSKTAQTFQDIVQGKINFDDEKDIWDWRNLLKEIANLQIERVNRIQNILEANFGDDQQIQPRKASNWTEFCGRMLPAALEANPLLSGDGVTLGIEDILALDLVERKERPKPSNDPSPENSQRALEDQEIPLPYNQLFERILGDCKSLEQGKGIAIIGEAGAGKTTLLCKISHWVMERNDLPIFISLRDLEGKLEDYILETWLKKATRQRKASEELQDELIELCNAGQVWLLLDGIDEIGASQKALYSLSQELKKGWLSSNRIVTTCRVNIWDKSRNDLEASFQCFRSRGFKDEEQIAFINKFFAKAQKSEIGEKLIRQLEDAPLRLKDLIKNPLWMVILCRTWKRRIGRLPETKAELYQGFVKTFYDWKDKPDIPKEKRPALERALGELSKKAIDQENFRFSLRESFIRQELDKVDLSFFDMACQLGWINKLGIAAGNSEEPAYSFLHPTFQEYFAALAIDDWDFFLPREHVDKPLIDKQYRIFQLHWKEVILLWSGHNRNQGLVEELNNKLISLEDGCGGYYSFQLYLIASTITSEFNSSNSDNIISNLIEWEFSSSNIGSHYLKVFKTERNKVLLEANRQIVIAKLKDTLQNNSWPSKELEPVLIELKIKEKSFPYFLRPKVSTETDATRKSKASTETVATRKSSNIAELVESISWTTRGFDELYSVIPELYSYSFKEKILSVSSVNVLIDLLRSPMTLNLEDAHGELTPLHKFIDLVNNDSVKGLFVTNQLFIIRISAIDRLSELALNHSEIISKLVNVFNSSNDKYVKQGILWSLGKIADSNRQATAFLLDVLETTVEPILGETALQFLERISQADLLEIVVKRLKNYECQEVEAILWHCARHLEYSDFYLAWNSSP